MANKITVLLDLVTDKATTAAKGFKSSIADAEGAANKFKAGASSAFATVQANAGALALGAGAALVGFGVKSVKAFQDTALAAGKFSDATGLAVEDASRLQEVASDLGISTDALSSDFKFLQKSIASNSAEVKQLGIETKRTKDGQVDVNATFLEAIDKLGGVEDANQRALIASKLFGRGFADSAELILGDADDIKKRLDEVSGAQVISDAQVARARKFRDQMDDLSDSLKQVELTVGDQLVPVIGALAEGLVAAEDAAKRLNDVLGNLPGDISLGDINRGRLGAIGAFVEVLGQVKDRFDDGGDSAATFAGQVDRMADSVNAGAGAVSELGDETAEAADELVDLGDKAANSGPKIGDMAGALKDARENLADLNEEARSNALDALAAAAKGVADAIDEAFQDVRDNLDLEQLLDDITDQFEAVRVAGQEATDNGEEGTRQYRTEVRRLREMLLDLLGDIKNVKAEDKIKLAAEIERGDVDELFRILAELSKGVVVPVSFSSAPTPGFSAADVVIGSDAIPSVNLLGLNPAPIDNSQTTIIYPVGSSPTTTAIDQRLYNIRNGPR